MAGLDPAIQQKKSVARGVAENTEESRSAILRVSAWIDFLLDGRLKGAMTDWN